MINIIPDLLLNSTITLIIILANATTHELGHKLAFQYYKIPNKIKWGLISQVIPTHHNYSVNKQFIVLLSGVLATIITAFITIQIYSPLPKEIFFICLMMMTSNDLLNLRYMLEEYITNKDYSKLTLKESHAIFMKKHRLYSKIFNFLKKSNKSKP